MSPKADDKKKEGVEAKTTIKVSLKHTGQNAATLKGLPPMEGKDLREMVGWLKYHGQTKAKPDASVTELSTKFNAASPEEKRKILGSFKGPNGKSLKWAKEMVVSEETTDQNVDATKQGMMTRPAGNKYVRAASFRGGGGPHVLIKHFFVRQV